MLMADGESQDVVLSFPEWQVESNIQLASYVRLHVASFHNLLIFGSQATTFAVDCTGKRAVLAVYVSSCDMSSCIANYYDHSIFSICVCLLM